jgi:hypothetical protein
VRQHHPVWGEASGVKHLLLSSRPASFSSKGGGKHFSAVAGH